MTEWHYLDRPNACRSEEYLIEKDRLSLIASGGSETIGSAQLTCHTQRVAGDDRSG
jgi:hypothetical protein